MILEEKLGDDTLLIGDNEMKSSVAAKFTDQKMQLKEEATQIEFKQVKQSLSRLLKMFRKWSLDSVKLQNFADFFQTSLLFNNTCVNNYF